jgi:O-antigen ligase
MRPADPLSPPSPFIPAAVTGVIALLPLLGLVAAKGLMPALILLGLLLIAAAGGLGLRQAVAAAPRGVWVPLAALSLWMGLSATWSITPGPSIAGAVSIAATLILGALVCALARSERLTLRAGVVMAAMVAFCALAAASELLPTGGVISLVYGALGLDANEYLAKTVNRAMSALVILLWPAMLVLEASGRARAAVVLPVLLAVPVFGFDSLSAKVALAGGLVALAVVRLGPAWVPKALAAVVVLGLAVWPVLAPALDRAVFSRPEVYAALPDTAQHRVEIWRFVSERIAEKPLLGWGMDTARAMPDGDVVYAGARKYLPLHPHNSVLQVALELGAVGLLLALAFVALGLRAWLAAPTAAPARAIAAGLMVAYLAVGFSAFGVWQHWWIALGFIAAGLTRAWSGASGKANR